MNALSPRKFVATPPAKARDFERKAGKGYSVIKVPGGYNLCTAERGARISSPVHLCFGLFQDDRTPVYVLHRAVPKRGSGQPAMR